jgi:dTDP-4-dehydrorhamnose reductase
VTRVVITGASGLLGTELVRTFTTKDYDVVGHNRASLDVSDPAASDLITGARPDIVINAAAWTDVDGCALDPERAFRINRDGAGRVADAAASAGALVVQISTNEVFDGVEERAYTEDDQPNPINPYGASKLAGERAVASVAERHVIVRTAWLYGSSAGFPARIRAAAERAMSAASPLRVVADEWGNPTPVEQLAIAIEACVGLALAGGGPTTLHLAGEPATTRYGWAEAVLHGEPVALEGIAHGEYNRPSLAPRHAVLSTERARHLRLPTIRWQPLA